MSVWVPVLLGALGTAFFVWLAYRLSLRWWPSLALRVLLLALIVWAVGDGLARGADPGLLPEILLVDVSDSLTEQARQDVRAFALAWETAREERTVIAFGAGSDYVLSQEWPEVEGGGSDLAQAIGRAEEILSGEPGRMLIATDGSVASEGQIGRTIAGLSADQVVVDILPLEGVSYENDVYLTEVRGAGSAWTGMPFPVLVSMVSQTGQAGTLDVLVDGQPYRQEEIVLGPGLNRFYVTLEAGNPGVMPVTFRVSVADDPFLENNVSYHAVEVHTQPEILFVTTNEASARPLVQALRAEGSPVTVISPSAFPTVSSEFDPYPVILIHDVLAQDFSLEQMKAVERHVVQDGRSAIFIGGRNSYTLGGYKNTLLEPLLPVVLAPPTRVQRVPITFLLVLDRSGSMAGDRDTEITPIELTREGAMRAIETLRPEDYLGVLTFSALAKWDVPIQPVGEGLELRQAQDKVSQIIATGGTFMYSALEEAIQALIETPGTEYPHILLMSDGVSGDGSSDEFNQLVRQARNRGISISTIALGNEADPETLSAIAAAGNGRFYQVYDPRDLPEVMISESRAVQAENVQEGRTNVIVGSENHPILSGFTLDRFPQIEGYIAVQSKAGQGAEDVLLSGNFGDPLLSTWQVGLGRTAAWMGDIGEQWVPGMDEWDSRGIFWQQVVRYTLPDPTFGESEVRLAPGEGGQESTVSLQISPDERAGLDLNSLVFLLPQPDDTVAAYPLTQTGPAQFEASFPTPAFGAYPGMAQYSVNGEQKRVMAPLAVNPPEEWHFQDPAAGQANIDNWLEISEGQQLTFEEEIAASEVQKEAAQSSRLYEILLVLLVLSWPAEIAVRRWQMPWRRP